MKGIEDFYINDNGYLSHKILDEVGFNSFSRIKDYTKCCNYITKYITKDCVRNTSGYIYISSRGLKKADTYEYNNINFADWSFENDFCCIKDFKTLRFSDIKQAHDANEYTYDLPSKSEHHVLKSGLYFDALDCEILLIDTMGELINLYAISDIVILGGSFEKIGGHNPLEVANFHSVLLSGKEIFNQQSLFASIHNYYLVNYHEIVDILSHYPLLNRSQINIAYNTDMITTILESP